MTFEMLFRNIILLWVYQLPMVIWDSSLYMHPSGAGQLPTDESH